MAFIRKVKTGSGATAVQIVRKENGKIVKIDHIGSAHNKDELQLLLNLAKRKMHKGQISLFPEEKKLKITLKKSYSRLLFNVLMTQYNKLGFDRLDDPDFSYLCIARLVEPVSKLDSIRVLSDLGVNKPSKDKLYRCLKRIVSENYRDQIENICFRAVNKKTLTLLLYDVTTLYFETQKEDEYRKPGLSKERRLEPQIVIGLLVDRLGFPLSLQSFEGNRAETKTILPVLQSFSDHHNVEKITVVADAAMMSLKNLKALVDSGYTYIVGSRLNKIPHAVAEYQDKKQGSLTDGEIVTDQHDGYRIIYQYKEKRAKLDLKNIEKQVNKAKRIVSGKAPVHRSKFVTIKGTKKTVNQTLIEKAYALAGIKGYVTNLDAPDQEIISAYHQLFQVETSFRMAKSDLKARPVFHRKRDSIEAHLTVIFTSLAVGRRIEQKTGISIKKLVKLLKPLRAGFISVNGKKYEVQEEIPKDIHNFLKKLN
jgi:transposase